MRSSHHNSRSQIFGECTSVLARAFLAVAALSSIAAAQSMTGGILGPSAAVKPPGLTNVWILQNLNQQIPLDLTFRDETGKAVHLGDYVGKKPVILSLVYYRCPMLCSELLVGLESALKAVKFDVGKEFDVLTISFDPKDTPEHATSKKAEILKQLNKTIADLQKRQSCIQAAADPQALGACMQQDPNEFQAQKAEILKHMSEAGVDQQKQSCVQAAKDQQALGACMQQGGVTR